MKTLKFGGSSLKTAERIRHVISIIEARQNDTNAVIVSAFGGVTNNLIELARTSASGKGDYKQGISALFDRHIDVLKTFENDVTQSEAYTDIRTWISELEDVLRGVELVGELSLRCLDFVMSFGELFSARIIHEALSKEGIKSFFLDTRKVLIATPPFSRGELLQEQSYQNIITTCKSHEGIPVVSGFIAGTEGGDTITLGRGGSDYTAAIFGAALKSDAIDIWTDVNGLMTADPRKVPHAFSQKEVSFAEALELSHFGAKVIYPPTIQPALDANIPVSIKNTFEPEHEGSQLVQSAKSKANNIICGISSIDEVALLRLQGTGMLGVPGTAARLFQALSAEHINVILITQASSEHTICFAIAPEDVESAKRVVENEFTLEMSSKQTDPLYIEQELAAVTLVGEGMRKQPGVAGKVFSALGAHGINVRAIAQGSSERSISVIVRAHDEVKALNALHDEFFFPEHKKAHLFLCGVGLIGKELLSQIQEHAEFLNNERRYEFSLVGVSNSKKMSFNTKGIPFAAVQDTLLESDTEADIEAFTKKIVNLNLRNSIFIDCTASENVSKAYQTLLSNHIAVVTPNKKLQSGELAPYIAVKELVHKKRMRFFYETSVGAGLPVIGTIQDLINSGDSITKIEGVLSGTLSYLFNEFDGSKAFSSLLADAQKAGYTEPVPREDLNGMDVARKILILAREAGFPLEEVDIENLVPEPCREAESVDEFYSALRNFDDDFLQKLNSAKEADKKLRYIACFEDGKAKTSLQAVDSAHPFYSLEGSDNMLSFTTKRYHNNPLIIRGPGAGAAVTAAGVFADIVKAVR